MGPVIFTKAGLAIDISLAGLLFGNPRYYPLPRNLLATKPKPLAPPPTPSTPPMATAPDPVPTPATASAPGPDPTDHAPALPPEPNATSPPADVVPTPWTEIQDAVLRGLKDYQHKTFREIGTMIDGKDAEDCRERYDELVAVAIAEKKAKEEEEAKIKQLEGQAKEDAEMRTWWAIHKAEKEKAATAEQKGKEVDTKKEEAMAAEAARSEEIEKEAMVAVKAKTEESKKGKGSKAEKRASEKESKKMESDTATDANFDKDNKGKREKSRGKDKSTASGKGKAKYQKPRVEDDTGSLAITNRDRRPIINLAGLSEEEIEEAPLLWHLHKESKEEIWNEMAAHYFYVTGQEISPKVLENKMKAMGL